MKRSRKVVIWVGGIGLVVVLIGMALAKGKGASAKPTVVRIEQAHRGELVETVSAPGQIDPKTNVQISAKVSARVTEMPFKEGERVTKGDPCAVPPIPASLLVRLDSKDLESRLRASRARRDAQAAQIEVERARLASQREGLKGRSAALEQARRDLKRQEELLQSKDVSQAAYDQAKLKYDETVSLVESEQLSLKASEQNLEVMQYNLEGAEADIAQAEEALSHTTIVSPIDGIVTRVNAAVGEMVMTGTMNNPGTVILEVADLSQMLVLAQVAEADVGKLQVGQKAKVTIQAYTDKKWTGKVVEIALTKNDLPRRVSSLTGTDYFRTEILLDYDPNGPKLYGGLRAQVEIETVTHKDVLILPSQAVLGRPIDDLPPKIRDASKEVEKEKTFTPVVYRVLDGKSVITPIRIGASNLTDTVIESGLSDQDKVIVGPYRALDGLKHDQAVQDERDADKDKKKDPNAVKANPPDPNAKHGK
ncbi:MAG: efflux RND transporter periplasmic adaptor subunit [Phycisphaerae bacterium]|nr:efflux RND transporter periplasmic adaptor subunit [Phycisphaerae bacterium]